MVTFLIYALALLVRLPGLFAPMWYDEIFSWWLTRLPAAQMAAAIAGDVHPPLFYHLLFGAEPWQMRLGPLACSLAGLFVTMRLARLFLPAGRGPLVVGLIYAISPFEIFYATELRMYAALQLVMLGMLWAMLLRRYWVAGALGCVGVLLHHYGWIYLGAWGVLALDGELLKLPPTVENWRASLNGAIHRLYPLVLPLLALPFTGLLAQSGAVAAGYWMWRPTLADLLLLPSEFLFSSLYGNVGLDAFAIIGGVVAVAVAARYFSSAWPWIIAPVALGFVLSWVWHPVFQPRPLVAVAPLFFIALVAGVGRLSLRARLWGAVGAAPLVVAVLLFPNTRAHYLGRVDGPAIMAAIGPLAPGDTIYHVSLYSRVTFEPLTPPGVTNILYPPDDGLGDGYTRATRAALGIVEALPARPDVVVIERGLSYDPAAESAARHLVAATDYKLIYATPAGSSYTVQAFKLK